MIFCGKASSRDETASCLKTKHSSVGGEHFTLLVRLWVACPAEKWRCWVKGQAENRGKEQEVKLHNPLCPYSALCPSTKQQTKKGGNKR